ncbi:hypothetical protein MU582_20305 [Nocardioidaceae bacterium SCSIO 66511]|nr:hypothetical protein MU582_20305 [Nocardioidaceae bacterium SCSIO 66511]
MMSESAPRPQKVTMACLLAGIGSLVVFISFTVMLADWVPRELRTQVEQVIDEPPLSTYDLQTNQVLEWLRLVLMAGAAIAVAAIILAIYTARRHRGARIGLTAVSAASSLAFVPSGLTGLLPAAMAVGCVILLWSREANDWFNPEKAARREERAAATATRDTPPAVEAHASARPLAEVPPQRARPADAPFGAPPAQHPTNPPAAPTRYALPPQYAAPQSSRLPGSVLAAILTATITSGLIAMAAMIVVVGYASAPADLGNELLTQRAIEDNAHIQELGWSADTLGRAVVYTMAAMLVLSLAAIGAALWMLRRSNAARIVLVVLSGITILVSAVATIAGLPTIAAAVTVIILVFRPSANAYFRSQQKAVPTA